MEEEWRDVVGYEGRYQVSNLGRVRKLNKQKTILRQHDNKGYFRCVLRKENKQIKYLVHRLVAQAFLPNPQGLPVINHKDENPSNNFIFINDEGDVVPEKSNLEWCTLSYNNNYGTRNERIGKSRSKRIVQLTTDGQIVKVWNSMIEAQRNGFDSGSICKCCKGKRLKTHHGFVWRYAE